MWIKLNTISGLILVIYPHHMLVSAKKKPLIIVFFSNKSSLVSNDIIKLDNFEDSNKKTHLSGSKK